jgi:uncharacterized membrane protein
LKAIKQAASMVTAAVEVVALVEFALYGTWLGLDEVPEMKVVIFGYELAESVFAHSVLVALLSLVVVLGQMHRESTASSHLPYVPSGLPNGCAHLLSFERFLSSPLNK